MSFAAHHNDSKWASQFRQHGITAAALSTSKVKQSKVYLNLRNLLEFGAQRNGSSMWHWKKPKKYHCVFATFPCQAHAVCDRAKLTMSHLTLNIVLSLGN